MKYKLHLKEIIKKISKRPTALRDTQLMHPKREWAVGLMVGLVFFISAASLGAYTYFKNQAVDIQSGQAQTEDVVYRESLVEDVLNSIDTRAKNLEDLRSQTREVITPVPAMVATTSDQAVSETVEGEPEDSEVRIELGL